jgi:SAM-dependent methyltransferase
LRLFELGISPSHHADFLLDAFSKTVVCGQTVRVLVSGAIDYSTFSHVLWACHQLGATADVTVVDLCETPLFLNLWYAQRVGVPVRTVRRSILDFECGTPFDIICTNAFFGQFSRQRRPDLMARWHRLLVPGGRVITVAPFRPGETREMVGFSAEEAYALRQAVLLGAKRFRGYLDLAPEELARLAEAFAARMKIYPIGSLEEMATLFRTGGFSLDHLSSAPPAKPTEDRLTGPAVCRSAEYALILARKPAE